MRPHPEMWDNPAWIGKPIEKPSQPLISELTKNLSPCPGCGKTDLSNPAYNQFFEKRTKGEKVKFILQVEVEAEDAGEALAKKNEGKVLSVNPRPQQTVTGGQQSTQRIATPQVKPNG